MGQAGGTSSAGGGNTGGGDATGAGSTGGGSTGGGSTAGGSGGGTMSCEPTQVTETDAGAQTPAPAGGCASDLDCAVGQYCNAPNMHCRTPLQGGYSAGNGRGGHLADGGACEAALQLPATCDPSALSFTSSIDVSRETVGLVESDTVLAADGQHTVLAAYAQVPVPGSGLVLQRNRLALSTDDGATWNVMAAPIHDGGAAANDAVLEYDPSGTGTTCGRRTIRTSRARSTSGCPRRATR
jgi:hypothetical protein